MKEHDVTIKITHTGSVDININQVNIDKNISLHIDDIDMLEKLSVDAIAFLDKLKGLIPDPKRLSR
jgi:hypothetical protein